ncbi:MAG: tyrosine-type recombinase/integrase [Phycisphaerae bacterium]|nr:tyrosine-type recombinase/integrase [Phycisphaerae bacterium]
MPGKRLPPYLRHKSKDLAYVNFAGKVIYLGKHNSTRSKLKYARLIKEWAANGEQPPRNPAGATIADLFAAFWAHAKTHYVKAGQSTSELSNYRAVGRILLEFYDDVLIEDFGPRQLKACREVMIGLGWYRQSINRMVSRIRTIFRWGVAEELVTDERLGKLKAVAGLRKGCPGVHEGEPVQPVPAEHVRRIMPALAPIVRAMVYVQKFTGMRSSELVAMKPGLIDRSKTRPGGTGDVWHYEAPSKSEHHGYERIVSIGLRAQRILRLLIAATGDDEYIFRPAEAYDWHRARRHAARKTPMSCGNRPGKSNRRRKVRRVIRESFTPDTYRQAIARACVAVGVPHWHPHQLRHSFGTQAEDVFDGHLDKVAAAMGHQNVKVTKLYAHLKLAKADKVARLIG